MPAVSEFVVCGSLGLGGGDDVVAVFGFLRVFLSLCEGSTGVILHVKRIGNLPKVALWVRRQRSSHACERAKRRWIHRYLRVRNGQSLDSGTGKRQGESKRKAHLELINERGIRE